MRMVFAFAFALALGVLGIAPLADAQQGLSTSARPNFGARNIANGFGGFTVPVVSTGNLSVAAMNLGGNCTGYATSQPDFNFTVQGGAIPFLRIFVDAGGDDTTLIVNRADGSWVCDDDTFGRNPKIDLSNAAPGLYNVWVGSYQSGVQARGMLNISQNPSAQPGGAATSSGGGQLSTSAPPNFGARNIGNGFGAFAVPVVSSGSLNVGAMNLGAGCLGYTTSQPDFNFTVQGGAIPFIRLFVEAGDDDTTLVVNRADGSWVCNDDTFGHNPMIDLANASPGLYNVWVGSYTSGVRARGTLSVSPSPSAQPGGAVVVNTPPPPPPPPPGGGQLSKSLRPNFGARSISNRFGGFVVPVVSNGTMSIAAMNLGPGCTGYTTAQPDFTFTIEGGAIPFIRIFADADSEDTTLVVNRADGSWLCNDDTFGHDPKIDLTNAAPGVYSIWVGTYRSGVQAHSALSISQNPNAHPEGAAAATTQPASTGQLSAAAPPTFGARSITPGISPDPIRVNVAAGGDIDAGALSLAPGCTGWVTSPPTYAITLTANDAFLRVYVDHVPRGANPALVVHGADGAWTCNDDSHGGRNPTIDLNNAGPGLYTVWIGSAQSGAPSRGRLNITELPQNHP